MTGSARGQSQLRQAFVFTNSYALPQPEMLVAHAQEKFDDQGGLTDEKTRDFLRQVLGAFAEWATRFRAVPAATPLVHVESSDRAPRASYVWLKRTTSDQMVR